jgi:hypothetical protein
LERLEVCGAVLTGNLDKQTSLTLSISKDRIRNAFSAASLNEGFAEKASRDIECFFSEPEEHLAEV